VVYGYLQSILRRGTNLTPQQKEALQIAASETERTIQMLQDLLDLARAECGTVQFELKPLPLDEIVSGVAGMTEQFEHRSFQIEAPSHPITVIADQHYLMQALIHLVNNAVQFSDPQQPVILRWQQQDDLAVIEVCDRGCGIPEAQQARIFEPFYRVDPSRARSTGGVGLGLAIAKALITGMNGTISVHSVPDQGSTFTITLPTRLIATPKQLSSSSMS
jgi:signal transduction histidine kinase